MVSEDDYISYLAQTEITNVMPVTVAAKLRRSHLLFLGYGLRDWTLRVFLQRVWPDDRPRYRSWAVDAESTAERDFWRHRGIDLVEGDPAAYLERLTALVREWLAVAVGNREPYKGLRPFEATAVDASLFFGRERERDLIAANLVAARLTVLYGASGVGKSSVLRAGVVQTLREQSPRGAGSPLRSTQTGVSATRSRRWPRPFATPSPT